MAKRSGYRMVNENDPQWCRFWAAFPKRVAKKEARQAWATLNPDARTVDRMLETLAWQVRQPAWVKDGGAFIPYPASWLRAERWTDEQPTPPSGGRVLSAAVQDPMEVWLGQQGVISHE